jgi:hypothetical protein
MTEILSSIEDCLTNHLGQLLQMLTFLHASWEHSLVGRALKFYTEAEKWGAFRSHVEVNETALNSPSRR